MKNQRTSLGRILEPQKLRQNIVRMAKYGNSGHIGCSLSLVNIVSVLYSHFLRLDWNNPESSDRDIIALSKGHGVMALYACFKEIGWISEADLEDYYKSHNQLKGLSSVHVPHIEVSGGSLGQGITVAVGIAKASQIKNEDRRVFCIVGDGECNEGSVWEALMFAAHHQLKNFILIIDANELQAMGRTQDVLNLGDLEAKMTSFGFEAMTVDGHDNDQIKKTLDTFLISSSSSPKALIAKTIKGKGISFVEHNNEWHYKRFSEADYQLACRELSI